MLCCVHYHECGFCRDQALSGSELTSKLEPAFLGGLRCNQPHIRHKFVEVFDQSMKRRVYDRLLYITCSQNWEAMGGHFWIKQCIEVNFVSVSQQRRGGEEDISVWLSLSVTHTRTHTHTTFALPKSVLIQRDHRSR